MRKAFFSIAAILAAVASVQIANGLQNDLIGMRADAAAFSTSTIGLMMACYYAGFSLAAFNGYRIIGRTGHVLTITISLIVCAAATLLHPLLVVPAIWIVLRLATGAGMALFDVGVESWINERTDNGQRGRIFSIYMTVQVATITLAQYVLSFGSPLTFGLYLLAALLFLFGVLPIQSARRQAPQGTPPRPLSLIRLCRLSPAGAGAVLVAGIAWATIFTMGPVYAQQSGLPVSHVGLFMGLALGFGALMQFPSGWLSDHIGRRPVLMFLCLGGIVAGLIGLWTNMHGETTIFCASAMAGGFTFPIYTVAAAWVNDAIAPEERVPAAAGLLLLFGLGSILGPLLCAATMPAVGPGGYYVVLIAAMLCGTGLIFMRAGRRT